MTYLINKKIAKIVSEKTYQLVTLKIKTGNQPPPGMSKELNKSPLISKPSGKRDVGKKLPIIKPI